MYRFSDARRIKRRGVKLGVYYTQRYDDITKTQTWVSTGQRTAKLAKAWVEARRAEQASGIPQKRPEADILFRDAYDRWLREKQARRTKGYTETIRTRAEAYWIPFFGAKRLRDVSRDDVVAYINKRKLGTIVGPHRSPAPAAADPGAEGKPRKPGARKHKAPSPTTVNNDLRALASLFKYALDERGWISASPVTAKSLLETTTKRRTFTLTDAEEGRLLEACVTVPSVTVTATRNAGGRAGGRRTASKRRFTQSAPPPIYLRALVVTALRCGFRRRTLMSLRWGHIVEGCWRIPGEMMKMGEPYEAPVPKVVLAELEAYRKRVADLCVEKGIPITDRLGTEASIFGLSEAASVRKAFRSAARRAGLRLTLHDCRRIFLQRLRAAGVSVDVAMSLTAHKSIATVMKHYREVPLAEKVEAIKALDAASGTKGNATEEAAER